MIKTNMAPQLTILIGIPGSGKSTLARKLAEEQAGAILVSTDELRRELLGHIRNKTQDAMIFSEARQRTQRALQEGFSVVYDATNVTRSARRPFLEIARELQVPVLAAWVDCRKEVAQQRNRAREFPVPDHAIDEMLHDLEDPTTVEGFAGVRCYSGGFED